MMRSAAQLKSMNGHLTNVSTVVLVAIGFASVGYGSAVAQSRYVDPRGYEANTAFAQEPLPPVGGAWRSQLLSRGCGHGYPMAEHAGCGTATGGPAGGIN